jgi:hypothetical protein
LAFDNAVTLARGLQVVAAMARAYATVPWGGRVSGLMLSWIFVVFLVPIVSATGKKLSLSFSSKGQG